MEVGELSGVSILAGAILVWKRWKGRCARSKGNWDLQRLNESSQLSIESCL